MQDLFSADGSYNPRNRFNNSTESGAVHLIQQNNTLGAEIEIAAAATIIRQRDDQILTSEQDRILCGQYGQPDRHSDPHIGSEVKALAPDHDDITLANPIGLCIAGLSTLAFRTPDGSDPATYWSVTRGTTDKALLTVHEVAPGKGFVVGDIKINGHPIQFGAQIVNFITIKLTGLAHGWARARCRQSTAASSNERNPPPKGCPSCRYYRL
jgi:hypothetical protein